MTTPNPLATSVHRPALVTVLVVLTVVGGLAAILAGVMGLIAVSGFTAGGGLFILLGLIYLAVAKGLADGNPLSRTIVAAVSVVQVVVAVATMINTDDSGTRSSAISSLVFGAIILAILYSPSANAFFTARRR